ncbi:MAG: stage V sporulation T C-terminal domain-containing protein [Emergencia sp.]|nr:stage V sporulation T C-terminal domain-containing protein [Emergencia sp.]
MKATGIVRRIDDLGRVVVPKEIRRILRIREGDPLEIYTTAGGEIILKKYSPIGDMSQIAAEFAETASSILGGTVAVSDTDAFIAASGKEKKQFGKEKIDPELDHIIQSKDKFQSDQKLIIPIVSQGDAIGSITILAAESKALGEAERKAAEIGADFIAKQIYN